MLPFHFYFTVIASILLFFLTIFTLMREEAVNNFIDENYEEIIKVRPATFRMMMSAFACSCNSAIKAIIVHLIRPPLHNC